MLIGSPICHVDWHNNGWPWVTLNGNVRIVRYLCGLNNVCRKNWAQISISSQMSLTAHAMLVLKISYYIAVCTLFSVIVSACRWRNHSHRGGLSWSVVGRHSSRRSPENDVMQWQVVSLELAWCPGSAAQSFHRPRLSVVNNVGYEQYCVDFYMHCLVQQLSAWFVYLMLAGTV